MGCNTSQEAMQAVENKVEAARAKSKDIIDNGKTQINNFMQDMKQNATEVEEIDIDLDDPKTEEAATKIQAAFRGHQTRRTMMQGEKDPEPEPNFAEEFSPDDKELCDAATKIQASFRGHMARKTGPRKEDDEELSKELEKLDAKAPEEEELDIDLTDPDLQVAATKIQASFRGHKVRREKEAANN